MAFGGEGVKTREGGRSNDEYEVGLPLGFKWQARRRSAARQRKSVLESGGVDESMPLEGQK